MHVLLVDDHPLFALGFAHALGRAGLGIVASTASTLTEGLAMAGRTPDLDIVLIDHRLGGEDGLQGLRAFGVHLPLVARVLISGNEDPALARLARAAGASAFLGKSMTIEQVLGVLRTVLAGGTHFGEARADTAGIGGPTARQLEVLALVAQGKQNKQIADALGIAERTVKLHVTALLDALNARNRTHLLLRAQALGML